MLKKITYIPIFRSIDRPCELIGQSVFNERSLEYFSVFQLNFKINLNVELNENRSGGYDGCIALLEYKWAWNDRTRFFTGLSQSVATQPTKYIVIASCVLLSSSSTSCEALNGNPMMGRFYYNMANVRVDRRRLWREWKCAYKFSWAAFNSPANDHSDKFTKGGQEEHGSVFFA